MQTPTQKHHLKGFTLIEFLIIVAIGGILLILAQPRITDIWNGFKETTVKNDVSMLRGAADKWKGPRSTYSGVSCNDLVSDGYIDNEWPNCNGVNPFNGNYATDANGSDARNLDISVNNLGTQSCNRLERDYEESALNTNCSGGTLTVTFGS